MCIPGDHGAPFVSPIRRSYPICDSVQHLQTASVSYCAICNCAPCSHRNLSKPLSAANSAFHIAVYLPVFYSTSSPLILPSPSLSSVCLSKSKSIHLFFTLLLLLCWRLTCVTSNSELPIMTNSSFYSHTGPLSDPERIDQKHDGNSGSRSTALGSIRPTGKIAKLQKALPSYLKQRVFRKTQRNRHAVRKRIAARNVAYDSENMVAQLLNPALIQFICSRLPDPCARAAYLREHVRHELCLEIPFLYVLPNATATAITTPTNGSETHENMTLHTRPVNLYAPQSGNCRERMGHSLTYLNSDSLFEVFLSSPQICSQSLTEANQNIRKRLEPMFNEFDRLLDKSFCRRQSDPDLNVTGEFQCDECRDAYRNWLCTTVIQPAFPLQIWPLEEKPRPRDAFEPLNNASPPSFAQSALRLSNLSASDPQSAWIDRARLANVPTSPASFGGSRGSKFRLKNYSSRRQYRLVHVEPCVSWCTIVETLCPYFNPADMTANGGEPAFLCDEGHYHHSSRYQMIYRPNQQCETECCYSMNDMRSGLYPVTEGNSPTDGTDFAQMASFQSRSSSSDVPFVSSSVSSVIVTSETHSDDDSPNWSETDSSLTKCESLQMRCTHHGYSMVANMHQTLASPSTSPLVTDSNNSEYISHFQPHLTLSSNTIDQSSDLTNNRSLASVSSRILFSHLMVWTCVLPLLLYIWPACLIVQLRLTSTTSEQCTDWNLNNLQSAITQSGSRCKFGLDQPSLIQPKHRFAPSILT